MTYSILTPYKISGDTKKIERTNIGDGFILQRSIDLLTPHECAYVFTARRYLKTDEINAINSTKALILAGANQLNDNFSITPEMDLNLLNKIKVPIIPLGIGISGVQNLNQCMSDKTKTILIEIHKRIKYSSWRCLQTIEYLNNNISEISDKIMMTGCPVMYDNDLLTGKAFSNKRHTIVVTVTERDDYWERETKTIEFVSKKYEHAEKYLSLHQVFEIAEKRNFIYYFPFKMKKYIQQRRRGELRKYAQDKGFKIFIPSNVELCWEFYNNCDMHIGSRLHAHLYFLSRAKKSFLTYVDDRMSGFSQSLDFPLCDYTKIEQYLNYDFEIYRKKCIAHYKTMQKFISYLKEDIL